MAEQHRETVEEQGVKAALLEVGEGHIELIEPLSPESGVAKFIERHGEGMHHVAYQTDDIDAALEKVRAAGLRLIDEEPRRGIRGSRVAVLHPKTTGGVLTGIVEPAHGWPTSAHGSTLASPAGRCLRACAWRRPLSRTCARRSRAMSASTTWMRATRRSRST